MKKKSIISVLVAVALAAMMSIPAFAATDVNENEQRILDALAQPVVTAGGAVFQMSPARMNDARNFMQGDNINFTENQANAVIAKINAAAAVLGASDATTPSQLTEDEIAQVTDLARQAAGDVGFTITNLEIDLATMQFSFVINDNRGGGGTTVSNGSTIKQTGLNYTATFAAIAVVMAAITAGAVYTRKARKADEAC